MFFQSILELAHAKKVIMLTYLLQWPPAIWAEALVHILFRPKSFVEGAVPATIFCLVNQSFVIEGLQTALYNNLMLWVSGANKPIL